MKKEVGIIGLGKMGRNHATRLLKKGWRVVGYNRSPGETDKLKKKGLVPAYSVEELVSKLKGPRTVWLMVPSGKPVDQVLFGKDGVMNFVKRGDTIIDGGNSNFENTQKRYKKVARTKKGVNFMDVGVSGGPVGALNGACMMIGGKRVSFKKHEQLFKDMTLKDGYEFFEGDGAGHFVKMVHNGIEYGMMQAIAEGFAIMKKSKYKLNFSNVVRIYSTGSVIVSRLVSWLGDGFKTYGYDLKKVSGSVAHSGEGQWTVDAAKKLKVPAPIIEGSLKFRKDSFKKPSYTGKLLSSMRNMFGGHSIKHDK